MSVESIKTRATEVLGDQAAAERWLTTPKPALAGQIPLDLAQQGEEGEREVLDLLGRLEHGVFS
ncbi:MAG TPA: MbcA/ParS/Xre antitoxin family protein [Guyparkeria sp.]|nr:MbcA/ParS/Xre antitoxin family protein [Guyparkeria sp.]